MVRAASPHLQLAAPPSTLQLHSRLDFLPCTRYIWSPQSQSLLEYTAILAFGMASGVSELRTQYRSTWYGTADSHQAFKRLVDQLAAAWRSPRGAVLSDEAITSTSPVSLNNVVKSLTRLAPPPLAVPTRLTAVPPLCPCPVAAVHLSSQSRKSNIRSSAAAAASAGAASKARRGGDNGEGTGEVDCRGMKVRSAACFAVHSECGGSI